MQETLHDHFNQWIGVIFFFGLYALIILFTPYYKKIKKKPTSAYLAFVLAFAVEMHGIPLSMYFISLLIGKNLPDGILWGHTLNEYIGYTGMYINIVLIIISLFLIINGWYHIYHKYWKKSIGEGNVVKYGIYKYIRHPQYTGFILLTIGMVLEWATLLNIFMWPFICYIYYKLAKREERDMVEEFGEEYRSYMERSKMFIPFIF